MAEPALVTEDTLPTEGGASKPVRARMNIVTCVVEDPGVAADRRFGQAVLRGTLVGFAVLFILVTAGAFTAGLGVTSSLVVGASCAFMGSLGWGGMLGVTVIATREMTAAESAATRRAAVQR